jgi:hypothetical protein
MARGRRIREAEIDRFETFITKVILLVLILFVIGAIVNLAR